MDSANNIGQKDSSGTFFISSGNRSVLWNSLLNLDLSNPADISEEAVENIFFENLQDVPNVNGEDSSQEDIPQSSLMSGYDATKRLHRKVVMSLLDEQPLTINDLTNSLDLPVDEVMDIIDQLMQRRHVTLVSHPIWEKIFSFGKNFSPQHDSDMADFRKHLDMPITLTLKGYWSLHNPIRFG